MNNRDHLELSLELLRSDLKNIRECNDPSINGGDIPFSPVITNLVKNEISRLVKYLEVFEG